MTTNHSFDAPAIVEELDHALATADQDKRIRRSAPPADLLGKPSVARLITFALQDWAVIAACWAGMLLTPPALYPVWLLVMAGRMHALGVILHDATHMPLRGKSLSVRLLEILSGYPIATTLNAMRYHHLRHHRDSNMATDPYFKKTVRGRPVIFFLIWLRHLILVPFWTIRGPFGLLSSFIPGMRNAYARVFLQDRSGKDLTDHPEVVACGKEELGQVLFHVGVYSALYLWPTEVFYGYFVPAALTGLFAGYRVLREHDYVPVADRKVSTILAITVDHNLGPIGRMFLAPRNIGYHIVHHLHPQVALENLPRLRAWYVAQYGAEYPEPIGIASLLRRFKAQGANV